MALRLIFMGTPQFAVPTLMEIVGQGHEVAAVYTQPPRQAGRGMGERRSGVHEAAAALDLTVRHPSSLKDRAGEIATLEADAIVVVAYGLLLPQDVLDATTEGAYNVHASLLPRWRGAAPIARAIMAGDDETGVCIMKMEAGLDTGPVAMVERTPIALDETAGALTERLSRLGADLMARALGGLERGALQLAPQREEGVTYARKIDKAEAAIDFGAPARAVRDHVNGLSPWPGAHASLAVAGRPERLKVLHASLGEGRSAPGEILDEALNVACGEGAVRFLSVQRAGKGAMDAEAFVRGARVGPGDRFEAS